MEKLCDICGKPRDDTLFVLECGCTLLGHSGGPAAQHIGAGKAGLLSCKDHEKPGQWGQLIVTMISLSEIRDEDC